MFIPIDDYGPSPQFRASVFHDKLPTEPSRICENCRFLEKEDYDPKYGICHRFPKAVSKMDQDWCGEFKAK